MRDVTLDLADIPGLVCAPGGKVVLAGRESGKLVREALAGMLSGEEGEVLLQLDFGRVGVVDFSCADEFLGKLLPRVLADEFGAKYLCLTGLAPSHRENISVALERRGLAVVALPRRGGWTFLGKLNPYLRETFRLVYDERLMSARELSDRLALGLTSGSTRLINLYKQRLVGRRENRTGPGREYIYHSLSGGFRLA